MKLLAAARPIHQLLLAHHFSVPQVSLVATAFPRGSENLGMGMGTGGTGVQECRDILVAFTP